MPDTFRILVVGDEPAQRDLVAGFLRKRRFEVAEANGGRPALARFQGESFDLVLTDQRMDDLSGLELLRAVRAMNGGSRVRRGRENLIERAVVLTRDEAISLAGLPLMFHEPPPESASPATLTAAVEGLERRMIRTALDQAGGVQTRTAELLGISERILRYKLRKYGLVSGEG